jgi:rhodanese-related sulfurtransferase
MTQRVPFKCIGIRAAEGLLDRPDILVLDVRDPNAFRQGRIEGAQRVSISELSPIINGLAKNTPVLIYCYHGHASREYAQVFSDFGFSEVYSLDGGFEEWRKYPRTKSHAKLSGTLQDWLLDEGFPSDDIEARGANDVTPLMKASQNGQSDIVRELIAAGANLEARNADGNTALWLACFANSLDLIAQLIAAGIDIDNRNDNGATVLMYAASAGKSDVVAALLDNGADTAPETPDGFTALDMAATIECLTLLRRATRNEGNAEAAPAQA